jgi:hypothetical protein
MDQAKTVTITTREQLDELRAKAHLGHLTPEDEEALFTAVAEALALRERMNTAIRFRFASGAHWSNDIEICRCEGHLLPKQPYMWAVRQGGNVLGKSGEWQYEPLPSSRDDGFYAEYRFDTYEDAERAAGTFEPSCPINNARRGM